MGSTASAAIGTRRIFPRPRIPLPARLPRLLPELVLLVAVNGLYKYGRKVANGHTEEAYHHADHVWSFERGVHLPSEHTVQQLLLHSHTAVHTANYLYATVHFPAMVVFLGWMFARKRAHYLWIRRAIVIQTMLALIGHMFFPLAPPRMLPGDGMVDTAALYGPAVYGKPDAHSMANQYAAMPSLHIGWAILVAVAVVRVSRSRWRWVVALHAPLTVLVVVVTANHYWTDGIVAALLLAGAMALVSLAGRMRQAVNHAADAHESRGPGRPRGGPADREPRAARPVPPARDGHGDRVHDRGGDREGVPGADAPASDDLVLA